MNDIHLDYLINNTQFMKNKRIFFSFFILFLIFLVIIIRIIYIKTKIHYPYIKDKKFSRGLILDRNGKYLALNKEMPSVFINPNQLDPKDLKLKLTNLGDILDISVTDLIDKIKLNRKFTWIKRKIEDPKIINKIKELKIQGLHFKNEWVRYYPFKNSLSHVLGFVGSENTGLEGIEYSLDKELNPKSKIFPNKSIIYGNHIHLTIDIEVQKIIEDHLKNYLNYYQAKHGLVIAMKSNGEIIAIANQPDYNPNEFKKYTPSDYRNISISNYYEPGSLFKVLTAAILLENNLIQSKEKFECTGEILLHDRVIKCSLAHGHLDLEEILKKSCISIIKLSNRISKEQMYYFLKSLNFGEKTNILLSGESPGYLKPLTQFTQITKSMISFGYEIGATPIQILQTMNSILNGGILYPIKFVKHIEEDQKIRKPENIKEKRIVSEITSSKLRKMLQSVMKIGGTGYSHNYSQFEELGILGKTGTVFTYNQELNQYTKNIHTGFFGMIPLKTKDFFSILIMINHPQKGGTNAAQIAIPVFYTLINDLIHKDLIY